MPACDAMVLCAGLGTRLRPLTLERAKPAVPLLGRALAGWSFERLKSAGFSAVTINTHWLPDTMTTAAQREADALGLTLSVSHEPQVLGTGGGLWQARQRGLIDRQRSLLVMNGDVFFDVDLAAVLAAHEASEAAATMVLRPMPAGATYSPIEADPSGRIVRIAGYGASIGAPPLLFTGVHVLSPEALDLLPAGESGVVEQVYAPLLAKGARIQAVVEHGRWLDLGDPAGYLAAHLELAPEGSVDASAQVDPSAVIRGSTVGAGAVVEAGAQLVDCVVWDGARVAAGERLERTIVTPRSRTPVALG